MQSITVSEARDIAQQWVAEVSKDLPGFVGAMFRGSINWMQPDDLFPESSDIDIGLISDGSVDLPRFGLFNYKGLMIEAGIGSITQFSDVQSLLSDYRRSPGLWKNSIIVDPTGELTRIQTEVASKFDQPKWINLRIDDAIANCESYLDRFDESDPFSLQVINWAFAEGVMCHVLLAGGLKNPTVRRRYSEAKYLMENAGQIDVYERLLEMLGVC